MDDIAAGAKSVEGARNNYAKELADYRRKKPTQGLRFSPRDRSAADPDVRVLADEDLKATAQEDRARGYRTGSDPLKVCAGLRHRGGPLTRTPKPSSKGGKTFDQFRS